MKSLKMLKTICSSEVLKWIYNILTLRKKNLSGQWIVSFDKWIEAMKLEEIRNYLVNFSIASTFEA